MTDLEKFVELFKSVGIDLEIKESMSDGYPYLELRAGETDRVVGYSGFYTEICFDKQGSFLFVGTYE